MVKLKYIDPTKRPMMFLKMTYYPNGVKLPNDKNELKVTDEEKRSLLKKKNGIHLCFEEVKKEKKKDEIKEVKEISGGDEL